jgi:hypothetical protein
MYGPLLVGLLLLVPLSFMPPSEAAESIDVFFSANEFSIIEGTPYDTIEMEGFFTAGQMGTPLLPTQTRVVELPGIVSPQNVSLHFTDIVSVPIGGPFSIGPAPQPTTVEESVEMGFIDGKDPSVYGAPYSYPEEPVRIARVTTSGETTEVHLVFTAMSYHPIERSLTLHLSVSVEVRWQSMVYQVKGAPPPSSYKGYVIVTTNYVKNSSSVLPLFRNWLQSRGFTVYVITEDDYGYAGGQQRAINIRSWLIANQHPKQLRYVLLIGNPDPDDPSTGDAFGDVPMLMCWPQGTSAAGIPTDHFYADLTGSWDVDGDGYFGEFGPDGTETTVGVDFGPELYVGRLPVYMNSITELNALLQRAMNYNGANSSIMIPAAISNFGGEVRSDLSTFGARTDGLDMPREAITTVANPNGFSNFVMYETGGLSAVPTSAYEYDGPLTRANVIGQWVNDYGVVFWWGHGYAQGAVRKIWNSDDGDGIPEHNEILYPAFITSADFSSMQMSTDTFVFMCACNNGTPEVANNIGYVALFNGAMTTVSASRISYYAPGMWTMKGARTNTDIGHEYVDRLISMGVSAGEALYEAKHALTDLYGWKAFGWQNIMDFNLYGDPSLTLGGPAAPASLACSMQVSVPSVTSGQQVQVRLNVVNTGGSLATGVTPQPLSFVTGGSATASVISGTPFVANLLPGQSTQFTWTVQLGCGASGGSVSFNATVKGVDSATSASLSTTCSTSAVMVNPLARLISTLSAVRTGTTCTVTLHVVNGGTTTITSVQPHVTYTLTGTADFTMTAGPSNVPASLPGSGSTAFVWSLQLDPGPHGGSLSFSGHATGSSTGGPVTSNTSTASLAVPTPAHLEVEVSLDDTSISTGETASVVVTVTNTGQTAATGVSVTTWDVDGAEHITKHQGPTPASVDVAAGSSATMTYLYRGMTQGSATFSCIVAGQDAITLADVSSGQADSPQLSISATLVSTLLLERLDDINSFYACIRQSMGTYWDDEAISHLATVSEHMVHVTSLEDMLSAYDHLTISYGSTQDVAVILGVTCP